MKMLTCDEVIEKYYITKDDKIKDMLKKSSERRYSIFIEFKVKDWKNRIKSINKFIENDLKKIEIENCKFIFSLPTNVFKDEFFVEIYQDKKALSYNVERMEKIQKCIEKKSDLKR